METILRSLRLVLLLHSGIAAALSLSSGLRVRGLGTALRDFSEEDCVQNLQLEVVGTVPDWLCGNYIRNGPGSWSVRENDRARHLFDGFAMMARIEVKKNDIRLSTRFLESKALAYAKEKKRRLFSEFGTPQTGIRELLFGLTQGMTTDNAVVNLIEQNGRLIALSETVNAAYEIHQSSLHTQAPFRSTGPSTGLIQTAHPAFYRDEIINIGTAFLPQPHYIIFGTELTTDKKRIIAHIPSAQNTDIAWIHSFGLTRDGYLIFFETPAVYNLAALAGTGNADHVTFDWKPDRGTWAHVIHLDTGKVHRHTCPRTFFYFHCAQAFTTSSSSISVDLGAFENADIVDALCLEAMSNPALNLPESRLARLSFPLQDNDMLPTFEYLDDPKISGAFCEFLHANQYTQKNSSSRYVYSIGARRPTPAANALTKTDTQTRTTQLFQTHHEYLAFGEPTFIPRSNTTPLLQKEEDDGIIFVVGHTAQGEAHFLIFDAETCSELARAIIPFPGLPFGFHGIWRPSVRPK